MAHFLPKSTLTLATTPPGGLCSNNTPLLGLSWESVCTSVLPTPQLSSLARPSLTSISVRKWMASGRVTRQFLFRTSFFSFVHL